MTGTSSNDLMGVTEAAQELGLSANRVRQLGDAGTLPVTKTTSGVRLFKRADVERLKRERAKQAAA